MDYKRFLTPSSKAESTPKRLHLPLTAQSTPQSRISVTSSNWSRQVQKSLQSRLLQFFEVSPGASMRRSAVKATLLESYIQV